MWQSQPLPAAYHRSLHLPTGVPGPVRRSIEACKCDIMLSVARYGGSETDYSIVRAAPTTAPGVK